MLRYLKRRDGLADQEKTIRNDFVHGLSHDGDSRGIEFPFPIIHRIVTQIVWVRLRILM
jgi:hypothetical protein